MTDTEQKLATLRRQRTEMVALLHENRALRTRWTKIASDLTATSESIATQMASATEGAQRAIQREDELIETLAGIEREERELLTAISEG